MMRSRSWTNGLRALFRVQASRLRWTNATTPPWCSPQSAPDLAPRLQTVPLADRGGILANRLDPLPALRAPSLPPQLGQDMPQRTESRTERLFCGWAVKDSNLRTAARARRAACLPLQGVQRGQRRNARSGIAEQPRPQ